VPRLGEGEKDAHSWPAQKIRKESVAKRPALSLMILAFYNPHQTLLSSHQVGKKLRDLCFAIACSYNFFGYFSGQDKYISNLITIHLKNASKLQNQMI